MRCPSCDEHIDIEDWDDNSPFQAPCCGEWMQLDIDESTYRGATQTRLVLLCDEDVEEVERQAGGNRDPIRRS